MMTDACTGTPAASQAGTAQIYRVPEGFSAADLPAVDMSSGARAHGTIVAAFKQRFVDLRKQVHQQPFLASAANNKDKWFNMSLTHTRSTILARC